MRKYAYALCAILAMSSPSMAASGVASYYGGSDGLCGSKTASGQRFNCHAMTAAHRSLPFGTRLRVHHRGRSVEVTVNDRGPFARGRVLNLSLGAARVLGMNGTARVDYEVIN